MVVQKWLSGGSALPDDGLVVVHSGSMAVQGSSMVVTGLKGEYDVVRWWSRVAQ